MNEMIIRKQTLYLLCWEIFADEQSEFTLANIVRGKGPYWKCVSNLIDTLWRWVSFSWNAFPWHLNTVFFLRLHDKNPAPVNMSKLLSFGYAEDDKPAANIDLSSK